jgi:glycosyltransferase involved in cell wall biosynthesis
MGHRLEQLPLGARTVPGGTRPADTFFAAARPSLGKPSPSLGKICGGTVDHAPAQRLSAGIYKLRVAPADLQMTNSVLASADDRRCSIEMNHCVGGFDRDWAVILPFYNEADVIESVIASLADQTEPFLLLLVDNGSTDRSAERAVTACRRRGISHRLVVELKAGKVAALDTGLAQVDAVYVATCDADTYYPPDYLAKARRLLEAGSAMAGAWFIPRSAGLVRRLLSHLHLTIAAHLFPRQCLTGGAGQAFRRDQLIAAGGFDPGHWNLVLEDHEVCHRLARLGSIAYDRTFWCDPCDRARNRPTTRWNTLERLLYHASASRFGDWFFYHFLGPRLETRRLVSAALREVVT